MASGKQEVVLSRRGFVEGAVGFAGVCAVGGIGVFLPMDGTLVRPPGGQDERTFFHRCIRCGRCQGICPHEAIDIATAEDGFLNARTPKLNFRRGYCDFCTGEFLCIAVCPTGALGSFDEEAERLGIAVIDTDNCLLWRSSACTKKCMDVCAYAALVLDGDGRVAVVEEKCNGCGACEFVCPSASYQTYNGSLKRGVNVEYTDKRTRT